MLAMQIRNTITTGSITPSLKSIMDRRNTVQSDYEADEDQMLTYSQNYSNREIREK